MAIWHHTPLQQGEPWCAHQHHAVLSGPRGRGGSDSSLHPVMVSADTVFEDPSFCCCLLPTGTALLHVGRRTGSSTSSCVPGWHRRQQQDPVECHPAGSSIQHCWLAARHAPSVHWLLTCQQRSVAGVGGLCKLCCGAVTGSLLHKMWCTPTTCWRVAVGSWVGGPGG